MAGLISNGTYALATRIDNETVLWEGKVNAGNTITLSEAASNFSAIEIFGRGDNDQNGQIYTKIQTDVIETHPHFVIPISTDMNDASRYKIAGGLSCTATTGTTMSVGSAFYLGYWNSTWQANTNTSVSVTKVVGVGRK